MRRRRPLRNLLSVFRTSTMPARRVFLKGALAAWLAGVLGIGCGDSEPAGEGAPGSADAAPRAELDDAQLQRLLELVAGAVLPSKVDPGERRRIAAAFRAWLDGYDPRTEPAQYATYDYTPNAGLAPYPKSRIEDDLRELEASSRAAFDRSFAELAPAEQRELLRERIERLPVAEVRGWIYREDGHVALSLLDFYYHFDVVYRRSR